MTWRFPAMAATAAALLAAPAVAQAPQPAKADTPATSAAGATFTQPKDWTLRSRGQVVVAAAPEGDLAVAIVDVGPAPDARAAADAAWKLYRPERAHPVKLVAARAPKEGWDEIDGIDYETSPNEKLVLEARAYRVKDRWSVLIFDSGQASLEKRAAAVSLIAQSLRAPGYQRERFTGRTAHPLDPARVEAIKAFVKTAMDELGVPGVGLALIDHGQVIYEGGLGVRSLRSSEPVDANTLFMIASNTKGMSTLLLAEMVDAGKVKWDEPVTSVYPTFRLGSDETTRKVLIRHLVCACTGLPRKDLDWLFNTRRDTPATVTFAGLAETEPTSGFGEVFQYNNLMAAAAGYIAGHLAYPDLELGAAYDRAMREKVFLPLGMTRTTFDMETALSGDHADPHGWDVDGVTRFSPTALDFNWVAVPFRPAGAAWSSPHDMARYVLDELDLGALPAGQRGLVIRDGQHEYRYVETAQEPRP